MQCYLSFSRKDHFILIIRTLADCSGCCFVNQSSNKYVSCISNPQVQVAALKYGVMPHLIQKLTLSTDNVIQNRYLYALSTLVRHFPYAQLKLVESGGLQTLTSLVTRSQDSRTKVKVITLITDIVTERVSK